MASKSKDDFKMTSDEMSKFKTSMANPEFKKLFFDYMKEISDPANKQLYEQELAQLEAEKGFKVRYVKPVPAFCVKTMAGKLTDAPAKIFINICASTELDLPTKTTSTKGQNWKIPYSVAKPRVEKDHENNDCNVYDVVFHPDAITKSVDDERFKNLLATTALEGIAKQFNIVCAKEWKILKHVKTKGTPLMTMIREKDNSKKTDGETSLQFIEKLETLSLASKDPIHPRLTIPKFKIVHQNTFSDYQKFTDEKERQMGARPDNLVITIEIGGVASVETVDLDVTRMALDLFVSEKYKLHLDLPFPVDGENATAKFDKNKGVLVVCVKVEKAMDVVLEVVDDGVVVEREDVLVGSSLVSEEIVESLGNLDASPILLKSERKDVLVGSSLVSEEIVESLGNLEIAPSPAIPILLESESEKVVKEKDVVTEEDVEVVVLEDTRLNSILPPFHSQQNENTIAFIIDVSGVDASSLKVVDGPSTIRLDFSSGLQFYTFNTVLPAEISTYETSVTPNNLCLLLTKKVDGLWRKIDVYEGSELVEKKFLDFEEASKRLVHELSADEQTTLKIDAKQKPGHVIMNVKKVTSAKEVEVAAVSEIQETAFVNNLLYDID